MQIYKFHWDEDSFLMEIDADETTVIKLLEEYKSEDEFYCDYGWAEFLKKRGIKARFIKPDHSIYF